MRAAALLVAVEGYPNPKLNLVGPADGALKMRKWMLRNGGVAPKYMKILVSPRAGWSLEDIIDGEATLDISFTTCGV
jgi:hypothetical protein